MLIHREHKKKHFPVFASFERDEFQDVYQTWLLQDNKIVNSVLREIITKTLYSSWININIENVEHIFSINPAQKESDLISSEIEGPLLFLYKSIFEMIDGLFYNIEYVRDRKQKYILELLIIIPNKNIGEERNIYKQIGNLMREYPDFLIDFSLIRRKGEDIKDLSKGYTGYVFP